MLVSGRYQNFVVFFWRPKEAFMNKSSCTSLIAIVLVVFSFGSAFAHFGMLIPSDPMVMQEENRTVTLILSFSHPMEMVGMEMAKPKVFSVMANGNHQNYEN